jgi:adenylate cyclase
MNAVIQPAVPTPENEQLWHTIFAEGHPLLIQKQQDFSRQGVPPRCKLCYAPFGGAEPVSSDIPGPSNRNPRFCSLCDGFIRAHPGGAKVQMSMVFADVRGSTRLSETLPLHEYVRLINLFYATVTAIFVDTDGFMMDVTGDEVLALYPPGFSGVKEPDEPATVRARRAASKALDAVERLTGVSASSPPEGLPFGVSFHTAEVYIGTIRGAEDGIFDVRMWGPEVNRAARLCSLAKPGEAMISRPAAELAGWRTKSDEREVELKGFTAPTSVFTLRGE